ncbi:MAG TPA: MaoC/PaaZ C-terminal domain-containing protein [Solirubrobacterales bacterium]|nr:MaoC/PaaZ C-terminal domain-containing protein [Solirubrobacterales bacterium]
MSEHAPPVPVPDAIGRLYFEDMPVGASWVSPRRTITEADVVAFAGVSGDYNPLHVDQVFAEELTYGGRIAHGTLVLAVATGLRQQMPIFRGSMRALLEYRSWKFVKPVFFGDTILTVTTVIEARETKRSDQGVVVQRVDVVNQDGETVQTGELVSLVARKEDG